MTFEELSESYQIQAAGLIEGGVDMLLLETGQDTLNIKAGLEGIDRAFEELGWEVPVAVQGTVEPMGTLLAGQDVEAFYVSLAHRDLLWIGINCATGPLFMTDHIRTLASVSRFPVASIPNAGMPDEDGRYNETPEAMAETLGRFADSGWVNLVGGCCGTVNEHIRLLSEMAAGKTPRPLVESNATRVSGIDALLIDDQVRPVIVGERTNVLGSRRFRRLINDGAFEEAAEVGRRQARNGAHVLDVCLQDPDRDEAADVSEFLDLLTKKVKTPIMIDSTDHQVIELAMKRPARQVDYQFGEPGGRRGPIRGRNAAGPPLRRRSGGGLYRRRQGPGTGCHPPAQTGGGAAFGQTFERKIRHSAGRLDLRPVGVPGGHR